MAAGPTRLLAAAALVAAAALSACGGDDDDSATESFCEDYRALEEDLADVDIDDPEAASDAFDRLAELDPPDEIADEFGAIVELNREIYSAGEGVDPSDQEAVAQLQEQFSDRTAELEEESQAVEGFLTEECGVGDT
ncbi:MAG TPA: hypothetical protein VFB77_19890 [Acidimicrobiales bacterium]|nr:hypothetical protein [Acidimicrobiales bacterium]